MEIQPSMARLYSNNNPLKAPANNAAASNNHGKRHADTGSRGGTTTRSGESSTGNSPRIAKGASTTKRW